MKKRRGILPQKELMFLHSLVTTMRLSLEQLKRVRSGREEELLICDTALEYGDEGCQWIVEGYQTIFDEVEEQVLAFDILMHVFGARITHVVTPVGVGSLSEAVITHFARTTPSTKLLASWNL